MQKSVIQCKIHLKFLILIGWNTIGSDLSQSGTDLGNSSFHSNRPSSSPEIQDGGFCCQNWIEKATKFTKYQFKTTRKGKRLPGKDSTLVIWELASQENTS